MNKYEKQSAKAYDKKAKEYDNTWDGRMTLQFRSKILEMISVKSGDKVLDMGCGNGSLIKSIKQLADINACGIDISPEMINECKQRYSDITFSLSSGEKLDFDDNTFDMIVTSCVLHHLDQPRNFFAEAHRILKPNGKLVVADIYFNAFLRPFFNYVFSPLYRAGDNKLIGHKKLKRFYLENGFAIKETFKKGVKQIVVGEKN